MNISFVLSIIVMKMKVFELNVNYLVFKNRLMDGMTEALVWNVFKMRMILFYSGFQNQFFNTFLERILLAMDHFYITFVFMKNSFC